MIVFYMILMLLLYVLTYITNKCQYWAIKLNFMFVNISIDGYKHTHVCLFAHKLNCKVQEAVFTFINQVKQQCQHGMRLRQKPYPILMVMQHKLGFFGSNIAQVKAIIVIGMCCLISQCTKKTFNLSRSTH